MPPAFFSARQGAVSASTSACAFTARPSSFSSAYSYGVQTSLTNQVAPATIGHLAILLPFCGTVTQVMGSPCSGGPYPKGIYFQHVSYGDSDNPYHLSRDDWWYLTVWDFGGALSWLIIQQSKMPISSGSSPSIPYFEYLLASESVILLMPSAIVTLCPRQQLVSASWSEQEASTCQRPAPIIQ